MSTYMAGLQPVRENSLSAGSVDCSNDNNYAVTDANVSTFTNDAEYRPQGSNVSQFTNDAKHAATASNVSAFNLGFRVYDAKYTARQ